MGSLGEEVEGATYLGQLVTFPASFMDFTCWKLAGKVTNGDHCNIVIKSWAPEGSFAITRML